MKVFLLALIVFANYGIAAAQELNATVDISAPKLQTVDPKVFNTMEQAITDFLNNTRWTRDEYEDFERIECDFKINIQNETSANVFSADIAMQAVRPVYGSDYKTATLSHVDRNVIFSYEEYQPIENSIDVFRDNLSSVFTFYVYLILGLDADTFEPFGGDRYFQICQNVMNNVPPSVSGTDKGWLASSQRNSRYWVLENILSPKLAGYREAMYRYHRLGLDNMAADVSVGTTEVLTAINALQEARNQYPNSTALQMFSNAKGDEVVEIFKGADNTSKSKVMQIMRRIDVANANKYDALRS